MQNYNVMVKPRNVCYGSSDLACQFSDVVSTCEANAFWSNNTIESWQICFYTKKYFNIKMTQANRQIKFKRIKLNCVHLRSHQTTSLKSFTYFRPTISSALLHHFHWNGTKLHQQRIPLMIFQNDMTLQRLKKFYLKSGLGKSLSTALFHLTETIKYCRCSDSININDKTNFA